MLFKKFEQFVVRFSENKIKKRKQKKNKSTKCQLYIFRCRYLAQTANDTHNYNKISALEYYFNSVIK